MSVLQQVHHLVHGRSAVRPLAELRGGLLPPLGARLLHPL